MRYHIGQPGSHFSDDQSCGDYDQQKTRNQQKNGGFLIAQFIAFLQISLGFTQEKIEGKCAEESRQKTQQLRGNKKAKYNQQEEIAILSDSRFLHTQRNKKKRGPRTARPPFTLLKTNLRLRWSKLYVENQLHVASNHYTTCLSYRTPR